MHTKTDASYGVIPFIQEQGEWRVLVIHQYGSAGDAYWGFPKGHAEAGESPEEAAIRELKEETGLALAKLDTDRTFVQEYTFMQGDVRIEKTVRYFLGYVGDMALRLQEKELKDARWCTPAEARNLLTHDGTKKMFDEAMEHIDRRLWKNAS